MSSAQSKILLSPVRKSSATTSCHMIPARASRLFQKVRRCRCRPTRSLNVPQFLYVVRRCDVCGDFIVYKDLKSICLAGFMPVDLDNECQWPKDFEYRSPSTSIGPNRVMISSTLFLRRSAMEEIHRFSLVRDQLTVMLETEASYTVEFVPCTNLSAGDGPGDEWRRKICQWSFRVIDHFRLDREVVAAGMNILDRFLAAHGSKSGCRCPACRQRSMDSSTYQLAAMCSLYIAIKAHTDTGDDEDASRRKHFKLSSLADLSRGMFRPSAIVSMERTILHTIGWRVSPPSPITFCNYFLTEFPRSNNERHDLVVHVVRELSRYLTELAVSLGSECLYYPASQIAYCALALSMDLLTVEALPMAVRHTVLARLSSLTGYRRACLVELEVTLQQSLWPDMLLDTADPADPSHPIAMARECGIFDYRHLSSLSPSSSPRPSKSLAAASAATKSPVGVTERR